MSAGTSDAKTTRPWLLVFGALFVFSFAGASLTLAGTVGGAQDLNDLRLGHVPQPSLRLGA